MGFEPQIKQILDEAKETTQKRCHGGIMSFNVAMGKYGKWPIEIDDL
jgi:hypothetical protein